MIVPMEQIDLEPPDALLTRIKAPTLLIWGDKGSSIPIGNADNYTGFLLDVRVVTFPTLGNFRRKRRRRSR